MFLNLNLVRQPKIYHERRANNNFKQLYRFSEENVDWLASEFLVPHHETRGGALTNQQKMKIFLRYMADPGFQIGVGEDVGIHQSTVSNTIWEVGQQIYAKANDWIKFPSSNNELAKAMRSWQEKKTFPHAIGAIDCTHVMIKKPSVFGDEYINRKGKASFNVQAICDANAKFLHVDCSWPGSVHDSRIWTNSRVKTILETNSVGATLLGDEGYGLTPWLMVPYRNAYAPHENYYNKVHTKERTVIERAFGQLKKKFSILDGRVRLKTERIPTIIICCFVLHNAAKFLADSDSNSDNSDVEDEETPAAAASYQRRGNSCEEGKRRRNDIAQRLFTLNSSQT